MERGADPAGGPGRRFVLRGQCRTLAGMDAARTDDTALMLAYGAGDAAAFNELYARHRTSLYRFILRRVGHRAQTDELFQETWMRVIAARARYQPSAKFSTWLLQIAHNLIVDSYRRARPQAGAEETERVLAAEPAPVTEQPEHVLSEFEQRRRLQLVLAELPDAQRATFLLRMDQGLGLEEIATITGVGRETVKSRLRYALKHVRERLGS